jgi:uncharacterized protein
MHMETRPYWLNRIQRAWKQKSVIWLNGVRRVGKTTLCQSLPALEYFDCELPKIRRLLEEPESFFKSLSTSKPIVLDEIHRLPNPSEPLKIAADHFSQHRVIATGSSTLAAGGKFRDTLTDRKTNLWLTPVLLLELPTFHQKSLNRRMLHGGLPGFLLAPEHPEKNFQDWLDDFWAKDVQELFRLERRHSFLKFTELLLQQSGGIFEATSFAGPCEVSRTTIQNYLSVLEATYVAHILRPFNTRKTNEIVAAPKVYGFDTGFVCFFKGWAPLRADDHGLLWEHLVLNELYGCQQQRAIHYWRDKRGHEVDFVVAKHGKDPIAIECKMKAGQVNIENFKSFRANHPRGENYVVSWDQERSQSRQYGELTVEFVSIEQLISRISP